MREASNMSTTTGSSNDTSLSPLAMMKAHMDRNACMEFCSANVCSSLDLAVECVQDFIFPTSLEWLFICLHLVLFTIGVVGNFLVCFVVLRSKHMQTVTNLFIVNLAGADAVVLVLCSPSTVLQAVTESWFLGEAMCKVVHVFQITVVSVSVLTLCAIAVERYFAICRPLKSRITMRKVTVTIVIIWVISGALASPNFHNSVINTFHQEELSKYLKMCATNLENKMIYDMFLVIALYLVPMVVIGIFYLIISHHLWHVRVPGTMLRGW
ncbi:orexin receptor type 1 [Aplysia californica]|uniref:Orexin receptor type 1 n=1 Tax=Aplysia californica TaxID=6500 RepID=A0ABM1A299_APLCA|nr:orexin receptor type 1 [Aplysia californica]XP_012939374.1 orexin receptor type 1 [Aplysia californica]XP_012939376.1 orexin receptor type 1 [Aplysia californica]XP_012939377.1 orexin receptor type 1 [Aplysia californica]XP_012939378.1 orexin receptor type 1 [Aplysia californica]XP_012939379.1 orexin receptor type 1 [Aplysia californica]